MGKKTFLTGAIVGAAAMYLLDPEHGSTRRDSLHRRVEEAAESPIAQRVAGEAREATRSLHDAGPTDGATLVDRVRSEVMGRADFSELSLNIDAHEGTVSLRGVVDDTVTRRRLVSAVKDVPGVKEVSSFLHASNEPTPDLAVSS